MTALAATPQPNEAANAIAANPSSADLSRIWSGPLPRPSLSEPRIVSGPVQKTSEETTKPSMKRCRSAEPVSPGQPSLQPAAEPLEPLLEPQQRADDPADQQRAEHDQHRARCRRPRRAASGDSTAIADVAAISSVTRPSASVTTSRVRVGQPVAQGHADAPRRRARSRR